MTDVAPATRQSRVWDLPVRVFHWTLAVAFAAAYTLSESERWRQVHVLLGYTALGLIAFRIAWGFVGTRHARFAAFLYPPRAVVHYLRGVARGTPEGHVGHNPAGSYVIYAMLLLGLATAASGYCTLNGIGGDSAAEVHDVLANVWLLVVVVHVAGVVASSVVHRENLVRAMISGYKRSSEATSGTPAGSPARTSIGLLVALAVVGFWTVALLTGGPSVPDRPHVPSDAEDREVHHGDGDDD